MKLFKFIYLIILGILWMEKPLAHFNFKGKKQYQP